MPDPAPTTPKILIADDRPEIREILREHLGKFDVDLIETADGAAALESILVERPDLVILDVMMPELNGWEVCKYVREKEELAAVRILMLTAIGKNVNELTSPLYGADAYLDKPFELDALEEKISEVLATRDLALRPA